MAEQLILKGRKIVGGKAAGEALVTQEAVSFNGGVDNYTGIVTEAGHQLNGENVAGKVLVYLTGKGSTGGSYRIYDMVVRGTAPAAFVQVAAESITTIGAIMGEIPVVAKCDQDPTQVIRTGDYVEVDGDAGTVTVTRRNG